MWEGISARKDNLPELKTRDESRKRDERTRERRLKRDALIINPLSHMQPPSSSFVWEQGLSFADPVLWVCEPFPTHLSRQSQTENLTQSLGLAIPLLWAGKAVGICVCSQVTAQMESSIRSSFIKEFLPPNSIPEPCCLSPGSRYFLRLRDGVVWYGVDGWSSRSYLMYGVFVLSLLLFLVLLCSSHQSEKLLFNIPRMSGFWSVRAARILLILPRC